MQHLVTALAAFHAEVGRITKSTKAQYGLYADLSTVLAAVTPTLAANGLVISQTFNPWDGGYTILRTTLAHTSGESITSDVLMPKDDSARNQLHSFGAACTYLRRYALLAILNLAAEDDDGDCFSREKPAAKTASPSKPPAKMVTPITKVMAEPPAQAGPADLTREERTDLINTVSKLPIKERDALLEAFRKQFAIAADHKVGDYITNVGHAQFILSQINAAVAS